MQPLRDYLNESSLQYEGILDPDQNKVMDRMTDDVTRERIRKYCTYDEQKYKHGKLWCGTDRDMKITKIDKDDKGWYIETKGSLCISGVFYENMTSFYDYCISHRQKMDEQGRFLVMDQDSPDVYFRWSKHQGVVEFDSCPNFKSTDGLPEELNEIHLCLSCQKSKRLEVRNKTKVISLSSIIGINISGKGCKNVILDPVMRSIAVVPKGVQIHRPKDTNEFYDLIYKLHKQ